MSEVIGCMWVGVQCGRAQCSVPHIGTESPRELPAGKLRGKACKVWDNLAFAHYCLISHSKVFLKITNTYLLRVL